MPVRLSPEGARPVAAVARAGASLVAAAAVGSTFLSTARDAWTAIAAAGPAGPADGILLVVALGGALLSLWLGLGMTLSALSALPGALGQACSRLSGRIAPAAVRNVVAFVLGATLTAALVPGTAVARTGHEAPRPPVVAAAQIAFSSLADAAPDASFRFVSESVPGLESVPDVADRHDVDAAPPPSWSPEGPASPARPASPDDQSALIKLVSRGAAASASSADGTDGVVVHRGDTLWSIAARHLGPAATASDIDAEWHRWFVANRDLIGNDPNLIAPGQLLSPPPPRGDS